MSLDSLSKSQIDLQDGIVCRVTRPVYDQDEINETLAYNYSKENLVNRVTVKVKETNFLKCFLNAFPLLTWIKSYSVKTDFPLDIISGCTIAVMHIPQGMGYALLANVPPILGIYTAFFPVLAYFIFGTSRHNSMGTFAVVSIMTGTAVLKYSSPVIEQDATSTTEVTTAVATYTTIEVAVVVCFMVGIFQLIMYVFQLGIISTLLSETLVSGFTTGAAIHVLTSQIKDLFGLKIPPIPGQFNVILTFMELFKVIHEINWLATGISAITIIILIVVDHYLKPQVAKISIIPVPIELILVVSGTLLSKYLNLHTLSDIDIIKTIPIGFPQAAAPRFSLMSSVIVECIVIAIVAYTITVSMALIFAQKENYKIDFNQELLAMGVGNVFGSFFSCIPFAASLSRSVIQYTTGGKTQIASIVSCAILSVILLWIGPFFEPLPKCVLASIIVVALKGLLMQLKQLFIFWKYSYIDGLIWAATFISVVIFAIDIGLLVGILLNVVYIFVKSMKPYVCLLGQVPGTEIYLDINRFKGTKEIPNVKIFHYCGGLNFASKDKFKKMLYESINFKREPKVLKNGMIEESPHALKCLVLDFSALAYIDTSATTGLKAIIQELNQALISVFIAGISCPVYEQLRKSDLLKQQGEKFKLFPTIHDAVQQAIEDDIPISIIYESIRL